jgi:hypothetical protein
MTRVGKKKKMSDNISRYWETDTVSYSAPDTVPYSAPDTVPYSDPDTIAYSDPDTVPYAAPDTVPYSEPDTIPETLRSPEWATDTEPTSEDLGLSELTGEEALEGGEIVGEAAEGLELADVLEIGALLLL